MSLAQIHSRAQIGMRAPLVTVEVQLAPGLPSLSIVGLPETAVKEAKDRVRGALLTAGFEFPAGRVTINLAPADLPKEGGRFDLPIALGILAASGQVPGESLAAIECIGELALSGAIRPVRGVLPAALSCREAGRELLLAHENSAEAVLVRNLPVRAAGHLLEICAHLCGREPITALHPSDTGAATAPALPDLAEVRGQAHARRALEIAAAGGHNLLMAGPPGTGKTLLASRLPGILPAMSEAEALESAAVQSVSTAGFDPRRWGLRPFRAPHHTASGAALVGGGSQPRPGEISLAHNGVLFLDELPEFSPRVLEVLREPLESGSITISRAARQAEFPARFQLVAAMNPCPCGYLGDRERPCRCSPDTVARYRGRLSGPLLDRIDMHIEVPRLPHRELLHSAPGEDSATIRARVSVARLEQINRAGVCNSALGPAEIARHCKLAAAGETLLEQAMNQLCLSPRAYHRILRVARTIADLQGEARICTGHLGEAIGYRRLAQAAAA